MSHACHATSCAAEVPPELFMCRKHWFSLPKRLRDRIWAAYRDGQCDDMSPSSTYCAVAKECVAFIAAREGTLPDTRLYDLFLRDADKESV